MECPKVGDLVKVTAEHHITEHAYDYEGEIGVIVTVYDWQHQSRWRRDDMRVGVMLLGKVVKFWISSLEIINKSK